MQKVIVYFVFWAVGLGFLMTFSEFNFFQSFGVLIAAQFIVWATEVLNGTI